jgi:hypothetical protein
LFVSYQLQVWQILAGIRQTPCHLAYRDRNSFL